MRYMLLMYRDEKLWGELSREEREAIYHQAVEFSEGLRKDGVFQAGDPLHLTSTATTVRLKNGKTITTDGPFAETKEQLGGDNVVEAENLDEALSIAARHPGVRAGRHAIEVRPIGECPPR